MHRLPALTHILQRSIEGKSKNFSEYTKSQKETALQQAERFSTLPPAEIDLDLMSELAAEIQYDAPIYARLAVSPILWLHSGDGQAMKRICGSGNQHFQAVKNSVMGRVVSLESILYLLVQQDSYDFTAQAFQNLISANKTVNCVLSGKAVSDQLESARSFLNHLCRTLGRGFLFCPPCPNYHSSRTCSLDS